ncbi:MAG TPA: hypothetical protein VFX37_07200 [Pseudolabrys sp.]|nr:hypothetical protein [Pseudolabrys sp.]
MRRLAILAAVAAMGLAGASFAQTHSVQRQFKGKPGQNINIGIFASMKSDCTAGALPVVRLAQGPMHGKVTVKRGRLRATNFKKCLAMEIPAYIAFYRSTPDFVGHDALTLEIIAKNGKTQFEKITVTVTKPGASQGI